MKITPDRLAIARAVRQVCGHVAIIHHGKLATMADKLSDIDLDRIIESLPEPPDDSPATLPAPDVQGADKLAGNSDVQVREGCEMDGCQCVQCVKVRREGVIEGLGWVLLKLHDIMCAHESNTYDAAWNGALDRAADAIRIEIERLRNES